MRNWPGWVVGGSVQSKQVTSLPFHVWRKPKRLEQYPQVDPGKRIAAHRVGWMQRGCRLSSEAAGVGLPLLC